MSVVTEIRKTKQKWSLNPQGKYWSEDTNKFGQKMLEKMGWSRGKGLGAKENGVLEHVRVAYKNDTKGMGFKEGDGQWTELDGDFNALLKSLSGKTDVENEIKVSSLEKKSQSSKARVHYKKFTRGKDLSRYSEKDLANIFGKKSLKPTLPTQENEEKEPEKELPSDSFTRHGGSMVDYFKKKLPNFGKIGSPVSGSNKDSESDGETCLGFGFKTPEKKKRKSNGDVVEGTPKKLKSEEEDHIGLSNPAFDPFFNNCLIQKHVLNTIEEEEGEEESTKSKKQGDGGSEENFEESEDGKQESKKKKKRNREEHDLVTEEVEKKKKKSEKTTVETCDEGEVKKKKKKNKENIPLALDNRNFEEGDNEDSRVDDKFEVKRKKKKNKVAVIVESQNLDDDCQNSSSLSENFEVKRKKKKIKEDNTMALVNPVFDNDTSIQNGFVSEEFEVKRKKKKKSKMSVDNPNFDDKSCEESLCDNNFFEVQRKKKKKKKNGMAIDNPTFDDNSFDNQSENCSTVNGSNVIDNESSVVSSEPKKNKKRKKEKEESTFENVSQNLSISESDADKKIDNDLSQSNFDLILNVTSTPSVLETKNTSNSSKQASIKRKKSVRFSDVNEERIIPNNEDIESVKALTNDVKNINGTSNLAFNKTQVMLDENVDEMSKKFDEFQMEIENDMNEAKDRYVGEVGSPDGENEKLPNGTKLKFKYAQFSKTPNWIRKSPNSRAKSSYKHLIKGDIILGFNNTNLHEIKGYAVNNTS